MARTTTAVASGPRLSALFSELCDHPGAVVPADVAVRWAADRPGAIDLVRPAGHEAAQQWRLAGRDHRDPLQVVLWELSALSRVLELMILPYQPATAEPGYAGPLPEPDAYPLFAAAIGLTRIAEDTFHPFFHEIVEVEQADDPDEPIHLLDEVWPGYLLGSLLVQRAGVRVRAGTAYAVAPVATRSRLHWAWWRRHRGTHAFGGETSGRGSFRRDYRASDGLYYNVDAQPESMRSGRGEPPLSSAERLELLRHRCVLRRAEAAPGVWSWADHLRCCEPAR
jgi:hypothetical protein